MRLYLVKLSNYEESIDQLEFAMIEIWLLGSQYVFGWYVEIIKDI